MTHAATTTEALATGPDPLAPFLHDLALAKTAAELIQRALDYTMEQTGAPAGAAVWEGGGPALHSGAADPALDALAQTQWEKADTRNYRAGRDAQILPLPATGRPAGLLVLRQRRARPAALADLQPALAVAGRMLELRLELERADTRLAELDMLYQVVTVMGATLDLHELLRTIVERTQAALRSEACTLILIDWATNELVFEIPTGQAQSVLQQHRIPLSQGVCGWVARMNQPAIVNDPAGDTRFDRGVDERTAFRTRNLLAVPLSSRTGVAGVIEVLNKQGAEPYTAQDLALLSTLAGQVAVALDNAQLYSSLQAEHARFLAAEAQVRKELARDLHDGPAQQLAAIVMQTEVLRKLLTADPSRLLGEIESLESLARKANREVRTLQFQLRPLVLETRGLRAAIESYVSQLQETSPVTWTLEIEDCHERLPPHVEHAAFGIIQEALGNVRKHSHARTGTLRMRPEAATWRVTIADDGEGFDLAGVLQTYETRGSLGLLNMRERAEAMGGRLEIEATPGTGTTVVIGIPSAGAAAGEPI